jgi:NADPH-dependent curcumin reductase CurA
MKTRTILLDSRPQGMPTAQNFRFTETELPPPADGEVLLKALYVSVDPYMRGRMSEAKSYVPPYELHKPIRGGVVAEVVESRHEKFPKGTAVVGELPWQEYILSNGKGLNRVHPNLAPLSYYLGVLGMPGLTAYFGLLDIGKPQEGQTVVVSGAAGAVGSVVGQLAKIKGCRAVGIAGTDEKVQYLKDTLGFDAAINYKTAAHLRQALAEACPGGVDVYFDNVGGPVTDAVYSLLNNFSRIVICGQIAYYNATEPPVAPRVESRLLIKRALMQGFIVSDYAARFGEGIKALAGWVKEDKISYEETVAEGFQNIPNAFLGLFRGENTGKQLVKVADYSG